MLLESDKNKVYFSSLFARHYKQLYSAIRIILKAEGIACETISGTKDYWCRDYMPVQADRQSFAQFMYHPDYLELMREYETNVDEVIAASFPDLDISSAPIIADGGNFVAAFGRDRKKCVIMTMKTRCENNDLHPGAPVPFVSFVENVVKSSLKCDNVSLSHGIETMTSVMSMELFVLPASHPEEFQGCLSTGNSIADPMPAP